MINSTDIISYKDFGFDGDKYIKMQEDQILDRISQFSGRLYLEIGGKFIRDPHAARVLPGFHVDSKKQIFHNLKDKAEILFCVNAEDIISDRQLSSEDISYGDYVERMLMIIERNIGVKPIIVINKIDVTSMFDLVLNFERRFQKKQYKVFERYKIAGYPHDVNSILSENGFGGDDHIPLTKNLILVTGAASSSGKMSTCLGQIYLDHNIGIKSGYAKYETFPIWNLPLDHPVNLAYEAATVDVGDVNMIDEYHKKAYGQEVVNYNRDIEGFEIVMGIAKNVVSHKNYMVKYKSPTDMGINTAGFCITEDDIVCQASLDEIKRRKDWYQEQVDRGDGKQERVDVCMKLEKKYEEYIKNKNS
ncbi:MAG TPA: DUF1846 family protein [Candidatus Absconditabacterales bacterium]|nr:DUF1846 family protein [Candidatus Absconditabacterales bacterium]